MASDKPSVDSIFLAAIERQPDQRSAFLGEACGQDRELRARVERLLDAQPEVASFLESPAPELGATVDRPVTEQPGTIIGPYKLLQQIGEGGFGVVFLAEQERPVRRKVALKIIKPGMDTRQVIARFEAERQALAMMDHPNIARVLDVGATDAGRPYFVMDLVKGVPITDYCDQQHLPIRARLELVSAVCHAVQHAHQKGIIHRDLKPSNVLVAEYDGRPVPKIIDFGVAKATAQRLTEKTVFTELGQMVGTVEYMSPEQARFNQLDIDTRSDIYSLGVLLYEILTGSTPFGRKRLNEAAFDEMLRIIREEEPPKPSTRLSSSDALPSIAANRGLEPLKLNRLVQGELDWIVMKALEKDRNRRYETASSLAADIGHHLNDEPVAARPASNLYRFRKTVRRNKIAFAAGGGVIAALILGLVVSTWMFVRERSARQSALAAEQAARSETAKSKLIARFMTDMLRGVDPYAAVGRDMTILDILDQTARRLNELKDQPAVEADVRTTLGAVYQNLGEHTRAEAMHREALTICRRLYGDQHPAVAGSLHNLARALDGQQKRSEAADVFREALAMRRKLLGNADPQVANTLINFAESLAHQGEFAESEAFLREALAIRRKVFGNEHPQLASPLCYLSAVLAAQGKLAEAESQCREALALIKALDLQNTEVPSYSINGLAWFLATRPDVNRRNGELAVELAQRAVDATPQVGSFWNTLGVAHYCAGDWPAAIKALEKSMELREGGDSSDYFFVAMAHWQLGHHEEAQKWYDRATKWMEKNNPREELRRFRAEAAELLGITEPQSAEPQRSENVNQKADDSTAVLQPTTDN